MAVSVLKNNFFEFNFKFFQQISGTAIGTKFVFLLYNIPYSDVEVRTVFTPSPFVSHRSARKVKKFFGEVKSLSIRKNSGLFKMWFQKISGLPKCFRNIFFILSDKENIRLVITSIVMINV